MAHDMSAYIHSAGDDVYPDGFNKLNNFVGAVEAAVNSNLAAFEGHSHSGATGSVAILVCTSTTHPTEADEGLLIVESDTGDIYVCTDDETPTFTYLFNLAKWLRLTKQTSAPSTDEDTLTVYAKEVENEAEEMVLELFVRMADDGPEIQITSDGELNIIVPETDPLPLAEQTSDPDTDEDEIKIYSKEGTNETEAFIQREDSGGAIQVTKDGHITAPWIFLSSKIAAVSSGTAASWASVDLSGIIPVGASEVLLEVEFGKLLATDTSVPTCYLRPDDGSAVLQLRPSDSVAGGAIFSLYIQAIVGVDSNRTLDYYMVQNYGTMGCITLTVLAYRF